MDTTKAIHLHTTDGTNYQVDVRGVTIIANVDLATASNTLALATQHLRDREALQRPEQLQNLLNQQ